MEDEALLKSVSSAFAPFLFSESETLEIREALANFVQSQTIDIKKSSSFEVGKKIPSVITGVRRDYLEALKANIQARQDYANIQGQLNPDVSTPEATECQSIDDNNLLISRLGLLHQQKQYANIQALAYYTKEIQKLITAESSRYSANSKDVEVNEDLAHLQNELQVSVEEAEAKISKLEHAVIQARRELERGKIRLQKAKSVADPTQPATGFAHLKALTAARSVLTAWLEESLTKCSPDLRFSETSGPVQPRVATQTRTEADVDKQYEMYLHSREKLLIATAILAAPVSAKEPQTQDRFPEDLISSDLRMSTWDDFVATEPAIEDAQQKRGERQNHLFAVTELNNERDRVLDQLQRLVDESQLLQAYPILAKSEKFKHAKSIFGHQDHGKIEEEVAEKLQAWTFASDAAGETTEATVKQFAETGMATIDEMKGKLEDLLYLQQTADSFSES